MRRPASAACAVVRPLTGIDIPPSVHDGRGLPGDDVLIGAYAQILGGVTIGDGAKIGAMSVVLSDVPAGATAVGAPARVVMPR